MSGLKGLIFDLDGVVVNTVPLHFKAWQKMFNEYGKDFDFEDYKNKVDGIPRLDGARAILTDISDEELAEAAKRKQNYYLGLLRNDEIEIYDKAVNFVKEARAAGYKTAVASSSKNCREVLKLAGLTELFEGVIDGNGFKKGKPAPEIFENAADAIGLRADEVVVFEDTKPGVEAAKNAHMKCVGIDRHDNPSLLKEADIVIKSFAEISLDKLKEL